MPAAVGNLCVKGCWVFRRSNDRGVKAPFPPLHPRPFTAPSQAAVQMPTPEPPIPVSMTRSTFSLPEPQLIQAAQSLCARGEVQRKCLRTANNIKMNVLTVFHQPFPPLFLRPSILFHILPFWGIRFAGLPPPPPAPPPHTDTLEKYISKYINVLHVFNFSDLSLYLSPSLSPLLSHTLSLPLPLSLFFG